MPLSRPIHAWSFVHCHCHCLGQCGVRHNIRTPSRIDQRVRQGLVESGLFLVKSETTPNKDPSHSGRVSGSLTVTVTVSSSPRRTIEKIKEKEVVICSRKKSSQVASGGILCVSNLDSRICVRSSGVRNSHCHFDLYRRLLVVWVHQAGHHQVGHQSSTGNSAPADILGDVV